MVFGTVYALPRRAPLRYTGSGGSVGAAICTNFSPFAVDGSGGVDRSDGSFITRAGNTLSGSQFGLDVHFPSLLHYGRRSHEACLKLISCLSEVPDCMACHVFVPVAMFTMIDTGGLAVNAFSPEGFLGSSRRQSSAAEAVWTPGWCAFLGTKPAVVSQVPARQSRFVEAGRRGVEQSPHGTLVAAGQRRCS